jgi:hypothetical protein
MFWWIFFFFFLSKDHAIQWIVLQQTPMARPGLSGLPGSRWSSTSWNLTLRLDGFWCMWAEWLPSESLLFFSIDTSPSAGTTCRDRKVICYTKVGYIDGAPHITVRRLIQLHRHLSVWELHWGHTHTHAHTHARTRLTLTSPDPISRIRYTGHRPETRSLP